MANYFCEYCGSRYGRIDSLTANLCVLHPSGPNKGRHKLYEGSEKSKYTCKYCGTTSSSIGGLTTNVCSRHPNGANKGRHAPAL
jgi:DNA-directed RNA polymerase subunit RPC12/RpoP